MNLQVKLNFREKLQCLWFQPKHVENYLRDPGVDDTDDFCGIIWRRPSDLKFKVTSTFTHLRKDENKNQTYLLKLAFFTRKVIEFVLTY